MFWIFALLVPGVFSDPLLVEAPQGLFRGVPADDGDYTMFLGIPYGRVDPENPFGAAQPHPRFTEIFEANNDSAICPQSGDVSGTITLDCLNLNVYVLNNSTGKLPVLVWIHGGAFINGDGTKRLHGPKYLVRHNIIVVSINYRLGPFGFLCLDIPEVSGNQGFKDQTIALRWIRENIESFGGDPNHVTAYGESAGAASVEFHIASENEQLFQGAILSSGALFARWTIGEIDNSIPLKIASSLGLSTDNVRTALEFLKGQDVQKVIGASTGFRLLAGCVERKFSGVEGFLTVHPFTLDTLPKVRNMSIITGFNDDESLGFVISTQEESVPNDPFRDFAEEFLEDKEEVYNYIRRFYIGGQSITSNVRRELIDFASDDSFNHPCHRSLKRFLVSTQNVYYYIFSYTGGRNMEKVRMNITEGGAAHADELGYVFDIGDLRGLGNEEDYVMVDRMTEMWANFVKYGNPTPEETELLPVTWPIATAETHRYLDINRNLVVGYRPFHRRLTFWDMFHVMFPFKTNSAVNNVTFHFLLVVMCCLWKLIA
ncbi:cholinesterase-like [Pieris brassicae]|uniref:cholinesterase-like n=1 Tax=Pieris brassicae TaxID=7116 RepID=UPI001E660989|nr:cholinesterase-like [Pieris brassicae]